ncbi:MAG: DoxX family protein [Armatimonadetes bacterium]|nr:DoxX family protein [Armatimonadota bacterium]
MNSAYATQDRPAVDWALLTVRVIAGVIFMAHGSQKLFGAFGGPGLEGVKGPQGPGGGGVIGLLVAIGEFFGGLGLFVGFLSRFSAASIILIILGAIALVHGRNGFFLSNRGYEYNLALIGLLVPVLIAGPGRFALGRFLPLPKASETVRPHPILE